MGLGANDPGILSPTNAGGEVGGHTFLGPAAYLRLLARGANHAYESFYMLYC